MLGERIARLAGNAGLSEDALANETGLGHSAVSRIVSGQQEPKASELLALSRALAVPYAELIEKAPLGERVRVTAHTAHPDGVDLSAIRARLVTYLRIAAHLDIPKAPAMRGPSNR
ncbi:hypothetical protein GCM10023198_25980 [Promicromonospora umidemergens]|uniref:HTH cro/C1-type domain-containing protein n=2 Tax=Promicromonospora umidemergens TaxID=629679 RepID=A0ABP8XBF3_9MICO